MSEKRTHDYVCNGTTSLFAAFNIADGTVISSLHRRHRSIEFKMFLTKIDEQVPADLEVHLVCDNYSTHKSPAVKTWLAAHPRFQMHLPPAPADRAISAVQPPQPPLRSPFCHYPPRRSRTNACAVIKPAAQYPRPAREADPLIRARPGAWVGVGVRRGGSPSVLPEVAR